MADVFMTKITDAIKTATKNITKYKEGAEQFETGVGEQTKRLAELIEVLKACIKKLTNLKDVYVILIARIEALQQQISTLKQTTRGSIDEGKEECNKKLTVILELITTFASEVDEFEGDATKIRDVVNDLETTIQEVCDEGDALLAQQKEMDIKVKNLEDTVRGEETGGSIEQKSGVEQVRPVTSSAPQVDLGEEESLPPNWEALVDPESGNTYYQNTTTQETQWEKPGSKAESDRVKEATKHMEKGFRAKHESTSPFADPSYTAGQVRKKAQAAAKTVRLKNFQKYVKSAAFKSLTDRAEQRGDMKNWWKENDYTHSGNPDAYTREEHQAMIDAVMNGQPAASALTKGGRRTRKTRGGWQTPERLKSLSKSKPIRTLTTRKRKKKRNKKTKKNKRRRKKKKRKRHKKTKRGKRRR